MPGYIANGKDRLSWNELNDGVHRLTTHLHSRLSPADCLVIVKPQSVLGGLTLVLAVMHAGVTPVIDQRGVLGRKNRMPVLTEAEFPWLARPSHHSCHTERSEESRDPSAWAQDDVQAPPLPSDASIAFMTSGSTGQPAIVTKLLANLVAEATVWQDLYGATPASIFVSFISPFHIYGFLHGFFLPYSLGAGVRFADAGDELAKPPRETILITVPAIWSWLKLQNQLLDGNTFVTSGSSFGDHRMKELTALPNKPAKVFEILGTTESGGIGYRRLDREELTFQTLPSVSLAEEGGKVYINSPFFPGEALESSDQLRILPDGRFQHLGRVDRVVKIGGRRYSLAEIEANLARCCQGSRVICVFQPDEIQAKGGTLVAFIEGKPRTQAVLRQEYKTHFTTPMPSKVFFLSEFPTDKTGKVTVPALLAQIPAGEV